MKVWEAKAPQLELQKVHERSVQVKDRSRHRQTRRDKAWAFKEEHRVELWHFVKKRAPPRIPYLELQCDLKRWRQELKLTVSYRLTE